MNCYKHTDREGIAACVACGNFICTECDVIFRSRHYCKACVEQSKTLSFKGALKRSTRNRMIAGVCGGLAEYFSVDPTWIRVAAVLLAVFFMGLPVIIAYIILAIVLPKE